MIKRVIILALFLNDLVAFSINKSECPIDLKLASQYFSELKESCEKDNGHLWGINLYGKILFADPDSRMAVANQQNKLETFQKEGNVFVGKLEKKVNVANTAADLYGEKWTMVNWHHINKEDDYKRQWLLIHESWHRIQETIGFPSINVDNSHLDKLEGRIYLKLEWRALRKALLATHSDRLAAIQDALIFRNYRQSLFESSLKNESRFEMHEGLAEYTGAKLSGYHSDSLLVILERRMKHAENEKSLNWSFAYQNGPAYGILMDGLGINWRNKLKSTDDLGKLIQESLSIQLPENLGKAVEDRYSKYDGEALIQTENAYEKEQTKIKENYVKIFTKDTTLLIHLVNMNLRFNPNEIFPLDEYGNVYQTARVTDDWGILEVEKGMLLDKNWKKVYLSTPLGTSHEIIRGHGWTLTLNKNWQLIPTKNGYTIKEKTD